MISANSGEKTNEREFSIDSRLATIRDSLAFLSAATSARRRVAGLNVSSAFVSIRTALRVVSPSIVDVTEIFSFAN